MTDTVSSDSVAQDQLRAFIERIERMEEEKQAISDDIKVLREIIRIRKQDHAERMEQEALLDLYMAALGMQGAPREDDGEE